jgi:hypothetical protein
MRTFIAITFVVVSAATAAADPDQYATKQALTPAEPDAPPLLCILGKDTCRSILLTETTWGYKPGAPTLSSTSNHANFGLEAGLLINAGHQGFGGSAGLRILSAINGVGFVYRGRYRHWLSQNTGVDLSLGLLRAADKPSGGNGGTFQLSIERSDQIALVMDLDAYHESMPSGGGGTVFEVGFAVKFCGFAGIGTGLLSLLYAVMTVGNG